ncbi:MAG: shikimate dehydrogenase [Flavobacteriales bacterium]|nr:shikimate dehydrogenase [Flavobacteriales bacterium]
MRRFGLIGHPLSHSFSKGYFDGKFKELGIDAEYLNFDVPTVEQAVHAIRTMPDLEGVNVTIPYKQTIIPFLDELDAAVNAIGAANTVKVFRHGNHVLLKGFNTDTVGFHDSIIPMLTSAHTHALVLGTGGAAKAAVHVLTDLGLSVATVSRVAGKTDLTYPDLNTSIIASHTLIVNCTPVGMFPNVNGRPELQYEAVGPGHLLFDMVYNPHETRFMLAGLERGAMVSNGLDMLHRQAEASWSIWNDQ